MKALALILLATPALAEAPRLTPTGDVTIDYAVTPTNHTPLQAHVEIQANARHLRITSAELPTAFLIDRQTETAAVLVPMLKIYATTPIGRYDPERTTLKDADFERQGASRIAGLDCTIWQATTRHGHATACITPDGIILSATAAGDRGPVGTLRAITVRYAHLAPELFRVPENFTSAGAHP